MARWQKLDNVSNPLGSVSTDGSGNLTLPHTVSTPTTISTKWILTEDTDTVFFRFDIENDDGTNSNGMEATCNLVSIYDGEKITLASVAKTIPNGTRDEILIQFSPNVPGVTVATQGDRIQLGMGNPNFLGERTFVTVQFKKSGANVAGGDVGKVYKVECYLKQEG